MKIKKKIHSKCFQCTNICTKNDCMSCHIYPRKRKPYQMLKERPHVPTYINILEIYMMNKPISTTKKCLNDVKLK